MIVALYLAAVVAANLIVTAFGPGASVISAFAMIGAALTLRDRLHDRWRGQLPLRMGLLIAVGGLLSWMVNRDARAIALASCAAFAVSEAADALVYHALRRLTWLRRANGSNLAGAAVDSLVFPLLAFGAFLWPIVLGQFVAKVLGGALWSWLLASRKRVAYVGAIAAVCVVSSSADAQEAKGPPRIVLQAQAGTMLYPWNDYRPTGNVGANVLLFAPRPLQRFSLLGVWSRDVTPGAQWVGVVALQFRVWSR